MTARSADNFPHLFNTSQLECGACLHPNCCVLRVAAVRS